MSTTPADSLREKIKEKINRGICPFCKSSNWKINFKTTSYLDENDYKDLCKDQHVRPQELIKTECKECGYIAHFDYRTVSK